MKTIKFLLFGAMALFFMASCEKETVYTEDNELAASVIVASTPEDTKAYVDGRSVKWQANDKLYVFNDGVKNKTWEYTLSEGVGETKGTFTYTGTDPLSEGTAVHALFAKPNKWYSNKYQFYIESTPTLYGYDGVESTSSNGTLKMPMIASGTIENKLGFTHLASLIRIKLTNSLNEDITISSIRLTCGGNGYMAGLMVLNPNDWTVQLYNTGEPIISEGSVKLAQSDAKTFDFVLLAKEYSDLVVDVYTSENKVYSFKKSSLIAENGCAYAFNAALTSERETIKDFFVSIDGKADIPFSIGDAIITGESIVLKPNGDSTITNAEYSTLLSKYVTKLMDVDLSKLYFAEGNTWKYSLGNKYVRDMYLPKNVTSISGNYRGKNCLNMRLHVGNGITKIDYAQFNYIYSKYNSGAGFYVDADNQIYSSKDGILYDKAGTMLKQYPSYNMDTLEVREGVKLFDSYCFSNNAVVKTVICPSSLDSIISSKTFYKTQKLSTIIVKSANPPELNDNCIGAAKDGTAVDGVIIIDTGDASLDEGAKTAYTNAWGSKIGAWTIKTKAES